LREAIYLATALAATTIALLFAGWLGPLAAALAVVWSADRYL
jgi:hypothetical protein